MASEQPALADVATEPNPGVEIEGLAAEVADPAAAESGSAPAERGSVKAEPDTVAAVRILKFLFFAMSVNPNF